MRITFLISISHVFILTAIATGLASAQQVSLNLKQTPVKKVFAEIEKQTAVSFTYSESTLTKVPPIDITVNKKPLEKVLAELEKQLPLQFRKVGNTIAVSRKMEKYTNNNLFQIEVAELPISGIITDAQGLPLSGVTIRIKGKTVTTATDSEGKFQIEADINDVLVISYVGFSTREITVSGRNAITIQMELDKKTLEEVSVVSTGYQEIPKERATGSFVKVDNELFNRSVSTNILDRLNGVVSGLVFNQSSTQPSSINIRGNSTIYANNSPLIVLDGFAYDGDISTINPNDVEDISILRDASAASIWGVRAGNGVIVIRTKKGIPNIPLQVNLNANTTIGGKPDLYYRPTISSGSFMEMEQILFNSGFYRTDELNTTTRPALSPLVELLIAQRDGQVDKATVDAQIENWKKIDVRRQFSDHLLQNSIYRQYAINATGSTQIFRYFLSAGYDNNREHFVGNKSDRLTLRTENTFTPLKGLNINAGLFYTTSSAKQNNPGLGLLNNSIALKSLYPYASLADSIGNAVPVAWLYRTPYLRMLESQGLLDWSYAPLNDLSAEDNSSNVNYIRLTSGLSYDLPLGLLASINYQLERSLNSNVSLHNIDSFYARNIINQYTTFSSGTLTRNVPLGGINSNDNSEFKAHTLRGQLSFNNSWSGNRHEINAIAGLEIKEAFTEGASNTLYGYNDDLAISQPVDYITLFRYAYSASMQGRIPYANSVRSLTDRFISYYTNAAYVFNGKYILSASARMDASNLFGVATNQRKVPLWSAGLAWNVDREGFFRLSWVNKLKLRSTYGFSGNIDKSITSLTTTRRSTDRASGLPNATLVNPPNPNLSWEKIGILNLGLDFEIRSPQISASVDWYRKRGENLLGFSTLDYTSGIITYKGNVASMSGNGLDIVLNTTNINRSFKWNTNFLFSHTADKVTALNITPSSRVLTAQEGALSGTNVTIIPILGQPIYGLYSFKWGGLDSQNGDPQGYLNGTLSKSYGAILNNTNTAELVFSGSSRPTYFGGIRNTFSWKSFQLSANITYKLGYKFRKSSVDYGILSKSWNGHPDYDSRWEKEGDEALTSVPSMPMTINADRDLFYKYSDILISDGAHVRLQDISLAYDVDKGKFRLPLKMQIYLYGNNLGIIWRANKDGIDPDHVPVPNEIYYPPATSVSLGLLGIIQLATENQFDAVIHISRNKVMALGHINNIVTYHKCIKELIEFGYITYTPSYHPGVRSEIRLLIL